MRTKRFLIHFFFLVCITLGLVVQSYAASTNTAGEVLKGYSQLSPEARKRALEAGAKQERVVDFYAAYNPRAAQLFIDSFRKRYPYISPKHIQGGSSSLATRIITEYRAGKRDVDVIDVTGSAAFALINQGLVDSYFSSESSIIRSDFINPKGLWVAHERDLFVAGYNTRWVSPANLPRSYQDLLDKKWTDSISLDQTDDDWFQGLVNEWGDAKAVDFVRRLMQFKPRLQRGRGLRAQLLAAGEFPIALNLYDYRIAEYKEKGAPVDFLLLDPIIVNPVVLMLARYSPRPHAAALFIDWLVSEEGQTILESKEIGRPSVRKGMSKALDEMTKGRKVQVLTPEILGPKSTHYIKLFKEVTGQ